MPTSGTVSRRRGLRVGYLPQDVAFDDGQLTATQVFEQVTDERTLTDLGLLTGRDLGRPLDDLSVGPPVCDGNNF